MRHIINKDFNKFFMSLAIGSLGNWFDFFAIQMIFVHEYHASAFYIGLLMTIYLLPSLIISPFAGIIADHCSKKNTSDNNAIAISRVYSGNNILARHFASHYFYNTPRSSNNCRHANSTKLS